MSNGSVAFFFLVAMIVAVWYRSRPGGFGDGQYVGEVAGVLAVACLSTSLVLAMRSASVERAFGGLDRTYVWHRWIATAGLLLVVPHVLLVVGGNSATPDPSSPALGPRYGPGNALGAISIVGLGLLLVAAFLPRIPAVGRIVRLGYEKWARLTPLHRTVRRGSGRARVTCRLGDSCVRHALVDLSGDRSVRCWRVRGPPDW